MKIRTTRFGIVDMPREEIFHMPFGMLGFPENRKFVIIQDKEVFPFYWYQSVEDPDLAFVITSPFTFVADYDVDIEDVLMKASWDKNCDKNVLEFYVVVTIPNGSPEKMTANFIGPVVVNTKTCQAVQYVMNNPGYVHNFPLMKNYEFNSSST